jgi:hypothetical protein
MYRARVIDAADDILLDRRVPADVPLLESWWWRALVAGATIGLIPLLIVLWHFIDVPFGEWMEAHWPGLLSGFSILGAPELWLVGSGVAFLWMAAQRERARAQDAFTLFVTVGSAVLACGFCDLFAEGAVWIVAGGANAWEHLSPNPRAAAVTAASAWGWAATPRWRRRLTIAVPLVIAAEVAVGVAFVADAIAGAWMGALAGLVVPWIRWRGRHGWAPRRRWSIGAPSVESHEQA